MSSDHEFITPADSESLEWFGDPEYTGLARFLGNKVKKIKDLEDQAIEADKRAIILRRIAASQKFRSKDLREQLAGQIEEVDLVDRNVYFESSTPLMRLEVEFGDYVPENAAKYVKEAAGAFFWAEPEDSPGTILGVMADPDAGWLRTGLIVVMPDKEVYLISSTVRGYTISEKDAENPPPLDNSR